MRKEMSNGLREAGLNAGLRFEGSVTEPAQRDAQQNGPAGEAWQCERLAEPGLLAASVAHEVRNSLAVVTVAVEVLGSDYGRETAQRQVVQEILRRLDSVNNLVGDLLEYSKPLATKKEAVPLLEFLDTLLDALTKDPRLQGITVVREYRCNPVLWADPGLLERLFLNLALNAVQAMEFSGQLTIRVGENNRNFSISFIDSGCGMERGVREKLFGPFFSTKRGGSGLGLFLSKKYVEAHDGHIEVKTEAGLGSNFTVVLPGNPPASPACQVC
jgi:two-component system, NtrC family, sensor histidine kinase AtoS